MSKYNTDPFAIDYHNMCLSSFTLYIHSRMNIPDSNKKRRQEFLYSSYEDYTGLNFPTGEDSFTEDEIREVLTGMEINSESMEQAKDFFRIMPYLLMKAALIHEEIEERGYL